MKKITLLFVMMVFALIVKAQDEVTNPYLAADTLTTETGWGWKTTTLASDQTLMINENFQNWPQNHSKDAKTWDTQGRCDAANYTTWNQEITLGDGTKDKIALFKCASAPEGLSQNKLEFSSCEGMDPCIYKGGAENYSKGQLANPEIGDPLSVGFLEISRSSSNGTAPAAHGTFTLPAIKGAQIVQYAYSSLGGSKRGLTVQRSVDNGVTWTDVRNPSTNAYNCSERKDKEVALDQLTNPYISGYFCSGAGVYIEDVVGDGTETVMVRFTVNNNQDLRLHDLKLITKKGGASTPEINESSTKVIGQTGQIEISNAQGMITVYNVTGQKIATLLPSQASQVVSVLPGAYLVVEENQPTVKILVK
ncbi:DUF6383 domain-containing protein [Bacteroidales bacterium OttesenSCG-928-L03]|nr:DUF6383 domain-containing protein [Bacteroidales bacterium OttesenSCG-928-L03]